MIRIMLELNHNDDKKLVKDDVAKLLREHAQWLESADPLHIPPSGKVIHDGLGSVRWDREFDSY